MSIPEESILEESIFEESIPEESWSPEAEDCGFPSDSLNGAIGTVNVFCLLGAVVRAPDEEVSRLRVVTRVKSIVKSDTRAEIIEIASPSSTNQCCREEQVKKIAHN